MLLLVPSESPSVPPDGVKTANPWAARSSFTTDQSQRDCLFSLYLVQVQISADSVWEAVLADWAKIKDAKMDVFLYTVDAPFSSHCSIPVRRCFFDEMQVIMYESQFGNNSTLYNTVNNIIRLINYTLKGTQNIETSQCQKCETFQEKEYKEFMKSFGKNVIRWNREATRDF